MDLRGLDRRQFISLRAARGDAGIEGIPLRAGAAGAGTSHMFAGRFIPEADVELKSPGAERRRRSGRKSLSSSSTPTTPAAHHGRRAVRLRRRHIQMPGTAAALRNACRRLRRAERWKAQGGFYECSSPARGSPSGSQYPTPYRNACVPAVVFNEIGVKEFPKTWETIARRRSRPREAHRRRRHSFGDPPTSLSVLWTSAGVRSLPRKSLRIFKGPSLPSNLTNLEELRGGGAGTTTKSASAG